MPRRRAGQGWGRLRPLLAPLAFLVVGTGCSDSEPGPTPITVTGRGLPPMVVPANNPTTVEGVALGRRLFHDTLLSGDRTQACASCHAQEFAFTDNGERFSVGIDGIAGDRNAPAVINAGWQDFQFWDGRVRTLEDQALQPVPNPIEMHLEWSVAVERIAADPVYPGLFQAAFGTDAITSDLVVKAIAQFERTLVSDDSKFDRARRGEATLNDAEQRGFDLFFSERADCFHCHGIPFFTDNRFHNTGLDSTFTDTGLMAITDNPEDLGKFKSPTLRNVEFTAPYMHDGRFDTLEEVLEHYNSGGHRSATVDPLIRVGVGLGLTEDEIADVIAFIRTLSDPGFLTNPEFSSPFP